MYIKVRSVFALLSLSLVIFSCSKIDESGQTSSDPTIPRPVPVLLKNDVVQTGGLDPMGKTIIIDTLTGEEIDPCRQLVTDISQDSKSNSQQPTRQNCKTELQRVDGEFVLINSETKEPINAIIKQMVIATYPGSQCNTTVVGGRQWETCTPREKKCIAMRRPPNC